jgi:rhomboid protease GluP
MTSGQEQPAEVHLDSGSDLDLLNTSILVLTAAGINHRVDTAAAEGWRIYVPLSSRAQALAELAAYRQENLNWPQPPAEPAQFTPLFRAMSLLVTAGLALFYGLTGGWQDASPWFARGAGDSAAILQQGEWFRLVTPLTLHADVGHLLSNCLLGAILLHFFFHLTGNGLGLLALLASATLGNLLNVLAHGPGHHFVGFSTGIFSVIGMLCSISFTGRSNRPVLHTFLPLMAGLALLAFLGAGGERTDLGGHLFGLLSGLICGNFVRLPGFPRLRASLAGQTILGLTALACCLLSWFLAFSPLL